ncbi:MAG: helix-turn-helix transcriptional regulator [Acidimicrobiales bacterium]|nr:helix-turn-helix transcriptional regulator [Acidimicrobiales bacterium]MCB9394848.1 helix-turn-helix transcriptional regulator [Acidimicrobiaceae bacterium]
MRQTSFADFHCSLARSLEVMGDWWSPLILRDLWAGIDRFDDLVTDLGISRNLLAQRLERLVAGGIVAREAYQDRPLRHRYVLADAGRELVPILAALTAWGDRWVPPPEGPPLRFRHGRHRCEPIVVCDGCGERLDDASIGVRPGPGGAVAPGTMLLGALLGSADA